MDQDLFKIPNLVIGDLTNEFLYVKRTGEKMAEINEFIQKRVTQTILQHSASTAVNNLLERILERAEQKLLVK